MIQRFVRAFLGNFDFIYALPEAWLYVGFPFLGAFFLSGVSAFMGRLCDKGIVIEGGASVSFINRSRCSLNATLDV